MTRISDLPTPAGRLPLLGHALKLDVERLHTILEGWATELGTYRFAMGPVEAVVLSKAEDINQVLRERPHTFRREKNLARTIEELSVRGVFTAEGEAWSKQRRLAMQALGKQNLKTFFPLLKRITLDLRERWMRTSGEPSDVRTDCTCFTVDVTTELAFSEQTESLKGVQGPLLQNLDPIFPGLARRLFALAPVWRWVRFSADRELEAAVDAVRAHMESIIDEARSKGLDEAPSNLLDHMLRVPDGEGFDADVVFGNAMTMLFAGEDTTANTLAWAIHLLADHPDVVARMREEVDTNLQSGGIPTDIASTRLPYVEQVIHEVMRLKPVGPMFYMEPIVDTHIGALEVPAGTTVVVLSRHGALDPECFDSPWTFDPSRWADPKRPGRLQAEGRFVPFGSGPRICPGRALALLELRMALAMTVGSFDLVREGDASLVHEVHGFTMGPGGLMVRFLPRGV